MKTLIRKKPDSNSYVVFYLKCLLCAYILTVGLLLLLALLLYRLGLSEKTVSAAIILIYIAACLFAGFAAGRRIGRKKYLWGLLAGALYFIILLGVSLTLEHGAGGISGNLITVCLICSGSGMLGGMLG